MKSKAAQSPTRAPDPRPARTRAAILAAIERLGQQGEELSVSSVVAEAQLSRSSFYSQFNDIGDVAVQLVRELYQRDTIPSDLAGNIKYLLTEFDARRHLYAAVLGSSAAVRSEWEVCEIIAEALQPVIAAQLPSGIRPVIASRFLAAGTLACVIGWLRSEKPERLDAVAKQLIEMLPSWARADQG